jgi:hypothetical protein
MTRRTASESVPMLMSSKLISDHLLSGVNARHMKCTPHQLGRKVVKSATLMKSGSLKTLRAIRGRLYFV